MVRKVFATGCLMFPLLACSSDGDPAGAGGDATGTGGGGSASSGSAGGIVGGAGGFAEAGGAGGTGGGDVGGTGGNAGAGATGCSGFIEAVVDYDWGTGQSFGQGDALTRVSGPPEGGGLQQGSLDVVSLGNGGWIVVGFGDATIVDGPGPDFIVFENAFEYGEGTFAELGTVAVSEDGITWHTYPCDAVAAPYGACSGHAPVFSHPDNGIDPKDPDEAGGEAYDLADLGLTEARYVRIEDRADLDGFDGVYDLDAVALVSSQCDAH